MQTCGGFSRRSRSALARSLFILALLFAQYGALRMPQVAQAGGPPVGRVNVELLSQMGGQANVVVEREGLLYVGAGPNLYVLDPSVAVDPIPVGHLMLPDIVKGIDVQGAYAYVADRWGGFVSSTSPTPQIHVKWAIGRTDGSTAWRWTDPTRTRRAWVVWRSWISPIRLRRYSAAISILLGTANGSPFRDVCLLR